MKKTKLPVKEWTLIIVLAIIAFSVTISVYIFSSGDKGGSVTTTTSIPTATQTTISSTNTWNTLRADDFLPVQTIPGYGSPYTHDLAAIGPSASATIPWFGVYVEAETVMWHKSDTNELMYVSIVRYGSQTDAERTSNKITNNFMQICTVEKATFNNQEINYCITDDFEYVMYWWNKNNFVFSVSGKYLSLSTLGQLILSIIEKYPS